MLSKAEVFDLAARLATWKRRPIPEVLEALTRYQRMADRYKSPHFDRYGADQVSAQTQLPGLPAPEYGTGQEHPFNGSATRSKAKGGSSD